MFLQHRSEIHAAAFSSDGKMLATAVQDNAILLWDLTAGKPTVQAELPGHAGGTRRALIPTGTENLVSVGMEDGVTNWDLRTRKPLQSWELPPDPKCTVALTADGRYLAPARLMAPSNSSASPRSGREAGGTFIGQDRRA